MNYSIFPKETQNIKLHIPKDVLIKELSKKVVIGDRFGYDFGKKDKIYVGSTQVGKFDVSLRTNYRSSFSPRISIEILEYNNLTELKIVYQLETITKVIFILMIAILIIIQPFLLYFNIDKILNGVSYQSLMPMAAIFFLYITSRMGFYLTMSQSNAFLHKFLLALEKRYSGHTQIISTRKHR